MDLTPLFEPKTVAVVGASDDYTRFGGGMLLKFLLSHGYQGTVLAINPKRDEVQGLKSYPSLDVAPGPIDLAVFAVPAGIIMKTIENIEPGHIKMALILTSGFAELGVDGEKLQERLVELCREKNIRAIGPNSLGVVNIDNGLITNMSQFFDKETLDSGTTALISQSGAFGSSLIAESDFHGVHYNYFVSSGNEADLEFSDFGSGLVDYDNVDVFCGYLESIRNGQGFINFAEQALKAHKPIVVLKVGSSDVGAEAARSHTGSLVGSDAVADSVFKTCNVIRADDGIDLLETVKVLSRTPISKGTRLAILSHSGGAGVMAADAAVAEGMTINPLPDKLRPGLIEVLPAYAVPANPLDMTGSASLQGKLMADCVRVMLESDEYDAAILCVNLVWRDGMALIDELTKVVNDIDKPFVMSWIAPNAEANERLKIAPFAAINDPARAARALCRRLNYDKRCREMTGAPKAKRPIDVNASFNLANVSEQTKALEAYGVQLPQQTLATDIDSAQSFFDDTGGSVALKIASPDIAHRTEIGGVVTGIADYTALDKAYDTILANAKTHHPNAQIDGILVQEMITDGVEALIGMKRDATFGPMIAVGAGGTLVELLGDVQMAPAPLSAGQAETLIDNTLLGTLLSGYRGGAVMDKAALIEMIVKVSWLVADNDTITELDLNPVMVRPKGQGCVAVDFKFALKS
ncbi:MAG: acetate--CoA ligase family protein [Rhodospirillales bacterium]|jgi:acetate---CoA ligase (ADP-forming)